MTSDTPPEPEAEPAPPRVAAWAYRILGFVALGLAGVGAVLPLMPTTIFLLIAAWAFARGSPEWSRKLRADPRFGPMLRDWEARRAIPVKGKVAAVVGMGSGLGFLIWRSDGWVLPAVVGLILGAVGVYVVSRPS